MTWTLVVAMTVMAIVTLSDVNTVIVSNVGGKGDTGTVSGCNGDRWQRVP